MIIKDITLENFRQFKEATIEFATDDYSNITLILGENTAGKTTLLQAFLWCFYEKSEFVSKHELYNKEIAHEMKEGEERTVKVVVNLEHEDILYTVVREQICRKSNEKVSLLKPSNLKVFYRSISNTTDGQTVEIDPVDVEHTIKEILPEDLADYFFYDTERFGNITKKDDVSAAVRGLLGLTILENAIDHLGKVSRSRTVLGQFYNELNLEGDKKIESYNQQIDRYEQEIEDIDAKISDLDEQIKFYSIKKEKHEDKLRDMKPSMEIQKRIDSKNKFISMKERELDEKKNYFQNLFSKGSLDFFLNPLLAKVDNFLMDTEIKDKDIRDMTANSIQDILKRGVCICGTMFEPYSKEYKNLKESLDFLPPESLGVMINNYKNKLRLFTKNPNFKELLLKKHKEIVEIKEDISKAIHKIERYSDRLKSLQEAKYIQAKVESIKKQLRRLQSQRDNFVLNKGRREKELEDSKRKLSSLVQVNEKNEEIYNYLVYAKEVADWFQKDYDKRNLAIQKEIEESVNRYFQKIYHGNRYVKIKPGYKVVLYSKNNETEFITDESTGLETVKNFSFIAGLVDMAKRKLVQNSEEDQFEFEEEYPLVIDAPFSNVDEKHVVNISQVLPQVTGQLILIVMEKDWNYAADKLESRVGKKYILKKISETNTVIKEI